MKLNAKTPHTASTLKELHTSILYPRLIEEKMLLLLRQGKVSKWFSGIGQEAIAVGATKALADNDYILPLHRNLGVFTSRKIPLARLIAQWQGTLGGFTNGRDRSFHFGTNEFHIVGMISHLGPQLCVADGIALAEKLRGSGQVVLAFSGEGGTSEGDFHEALNVAAVWDLPVIFLVENNGYGLSTPSADQFRCKQIADRAIGYGIQGLTIDGNNLLEVYDTVRALASAMRKNPKPVLLECMTFRMRGHEEASGIKYVPKSLLEQWAKRDPIELYERQLFEMGVIDRDYLQMQRKQISSEIDQACEQAFSEPAIVAQTSKEIADVYSAHVSTTSVVSGKSSKRRFVDSIADGLGQALEKHPNLIIMGQDIAEYGGVFKVTEGLLARYGKERVRNTPLCESAIIGTALGLSVRGFKSVVEMQFADFVSCGFNQIVNNLAKSHYRWGQNADVVVRMPTGAGTGAGPFHSQSNEAWFFKTPGLKIVYPSNPTDAKGLLLASIEDPNPVMFFEHKLLYRSIQEEVPDEYFTIELGKARLLRAGGQVSIITYGAGVHWASKYLEQHPEVSADLIDLRTLMPLDWQCIETSIAKTNRVLILHEDTRTGGVGAELAALVADRCFEMLDAPVMRCASLDTPIPFAAPLEKNFLASASLEAELSRLLSY